MNRKAPYTQYRGRTVPPCVFMGLPRPNMQPAYVTGLKSGSRAQIDLVLVCCRSFSERPATNRALLNLLVSYALPTPSRAKSAFGVGQNSIGARLKC